MMQTMRPKMNNSAKKFILSFGTRIDSIFPFSQEAAEISVASCLLSSFFDNARNKNRTKGNCEKRKENREKRGKMEIVDCKIRKNMIK